MANLVNYGINSIPVTGRFLAHNRLDLVRRAFVADDLFTSVKHPVDLTMTQAAYLARVNVSYAWWAHKRQAERAAIEAGLVPLVPARSLKMTVPMVTNGNTLLAPSTTNGESIDDTTVVNFVRRVGVERTLQAAMVVEAAQ